MTFTGKLFSLARKLGLFTPVGSIVYSIVPCFMFIPSLYACVSSGSATTMFFFNKKYLVT